MFLRFRGKSVIFVQKNIILRLSDKTCTEKWRADFRQCRFRGFVILLFESVSRWHSQSIVNKIKYPYFWHVFFVANKNLDFWQFLFCHRPENNIFVQKVPKITKMMQIVMKSVQKVVKPSEGLIFYDAIVPRYSLSAKLKNQELCWFVLV